MSRKPLAPAANNIQEQTTAGFAIDLGRMVEVNGSVRLVQHYWKFSRSPCKVPKGRLQRVQDMILRGTALKLLLSMSKLASTSYF